MCRCRDWNFICSDFCLWNGYYAITTEFFDFFFLRFYVVEFVFMFLNFFSASSNDEVKIIRFPILGNWKLKFKTEFKFYASSCLCLAVELMRLVAHCYMCYYLLWTWFYTHACVYIDKDWRNICYWSVFMSIISWSW